MRKVSNSQPEIRQRHEQFILAYAQTGNASSAAVAAGYSEANSDVQGGRLLRHAAVGPRAREARAQHLHQTRDAFERQQQALREAADGAIETLVRIAAAPPRVGAQAMVLAAVAILDRAGHKPVERIEQQVAWADVSRELGGVDVRTILAEALEEISQRPDAQPPP